jgi:hypothetical protein
MELSPGDFADGLRRLPATSARKASPEIGDSNITPFLSLVLVQGVVNARGWFLQEGERGNIWWNNSQRMIFPAAPLGRSL